MPWTTSSRRAFKTPERSSKNGSASAGAFTRWQIAALVGVAPLNQGQRMLVGHR